jgi:hypothetical protein
MIGRKYQIYLYVPTVVKQYQTIQGRFELSKNDQFNIKQNRYADEAAHENAQSYHRQLSCHGSNRAPKI